MASPSTMDINKIFMACKKISEDFSDANLLFKLFMSILMNSPMVPSDIKDTFESFDKKISEANDDETRIIAAREAVTSLLKHVSKESKDMFREILEDVEE